MEPKTIRSILEGRMLEMERHLARFLKQQKDMRKERYLAHAPEMLESLAHQIGYMTGAIEQTREHLRMLDITDKQYFQHEKEVKEHNDAVFAMLKDTMKKARKQNK